MIKFLCKGKKKLNGHGLYGNLTIFTRGGGVKRKYRWIDFRRNVWNIKGEILRIEYDPNRSSYISLVYYKNGILTYMLSIDNVKIGNQIETSDLISDVVEGNSTLLKFLPLGSIISNLEFSFGKGAQIQRAAGTFAKIIKQSLNYTIIKLKSGELRYFLSDSIATLGRISNINHKSKKLLKAGTSRNLGYKPKVRAAAMNPVDHPLGGRTRGGKIPVSPWGVIQGVKTVRKKNKFIIKRRYNYD